MTGFYWRKNLAKGDITLMTTHDEDKYEKKIGRTETDLKVYATGAKKYTDLGDHYYHGARFNFHMNDKFRIAVSGIYIDYDEDGTSPTEAYDYGTYWADFGITFSPGFQFKGAYFIQDHDGPSGVPFDDSPDAYKAIIDVSQDALKFTSLWIEYAKLDPNFHTALQPWSAYGAEVTPALMESPVDNVFETEVIFVYLQQKWSDKWVTYQRYGQFEHDPESYAGLIGSYDITNWTFGVQYWYTPTVMFELAYDDVDYDSGWSTPWDDKAKKGGWGDSSLKDDSLIRFRTHIFF